MDELQVIAGAAIGTVIVFLGIFSVTVSGSHLSSELERSNNRIDNVTQDISPQVREKRAGQLQELSNSYCNPEYLESDKLRVKSEIEKIYLKDKTIVRDLTDSANVTVRKVIGGSNPCEK